ncbi:MAG: hypothetical protein KDI12_12460 [Anaerolineae bacterium]|nr:hypothetical protein [Anaerolineae bacterium]
MNSSTETTTHEMRLLIRVSVLLPIASVFMLGLTSIWHDAAMPDPKVAILVVIAILPALLVFLPGIERRLGRWFVPVTLSLYLVCQTTLTSLLQNLGMARFDMMSVGSINVVEPGVLVMIPLLLIAWQFGWKGALLASATAGTLHMLIGLAMHQWMPSDPQVAEVVPILRPDLLYFLPLLVAYLGGLLRRQQRQEEAAHMRWREYAATAEVLAVQRERKRLAQQLRTGVVETLAILATQLDSLTGVLAGRPQDESDAVQDVQKAVRADIQSVSEWVDELQASPLESSELEAALKACASAMSHRTGVSVDVQVGDLPGDLTPIQELSLYHVADQALNHMVNHRGVSQVAVRLSTVDQVVALTVHDDGLCRCQEAEHNEIDDLEAYASLVGGQLCFHQQAEHGNTVALWLPCKNNHSSDS